MFAQITSSIGHYVMFPSVTGANTQKLPTQILIAAAMIVGASLLGLLVGFLLGAQYGRMSGELRVLKAIKSDRPRRSRRSSELEREPI